MCTRYLPVPRPLTEYFPLTMVPPAPFASPPWGKKEIEPFSIFCAVQGHRSIDPGAITAVTATTAADRQQDRQQLA